MKTGIYNLGLCNQSRVEMQMQKYGEKIMMFTVTQKAKVV